MIRNAPFDLPPRPFVRQLRGARPHIPTARAQPMRGFEDGFTDIVDYIVRITDEIWADRGVGRIYDTYAQDCVIYSAGPTVRGVDTVVANTVMGINSAPDGYTRHLNVAWSGDQSAGFYTSHLGFARSTNTGLSAYGPATGKRIGRYFVADCISTDNKIHTEWLMRDNSAMVRQMGLDLHAVARQLAEAPGPSVPVDETGSERARHEGPTDTPERWAQHHFDEVWNKRRFDHVAQHYTRDAVAHWCGGREARGRRPIQELVVGLLASLPDGEVRIGHVCWSEEGDGVLLAVRWELAGTTRPGGMLGDVPPGRPLTILASTHLRFVGGYVVEEWTVFDEVAALVQAYRA